MAIVYGALGKFPVVLSSATPSLESLVNAERGRYGHVRLHARHGEAELPPSHIIDMRQVSIVFGCVAIRAPGACGRRDARERRPGAAVPQSPRLCAVDALPGLRPSHRLSELRRFIGRAPLPQAADVPSLRPHTGNPARVSQMQDAGQARAVRAWRRATGGGSRSALSGSAPRHSVERSRRAAPCSRIHCAKWRKACINLVIGTQLVAKGHHFPHLTLVRRRRCRSGARFRRPACR